MTSTVGSPFSSFFPLKIKPKFQNTDFHIWISIIHMINYSISTNNVPGPVQWFSKLNLTLKLSNFKIFLFLCQAYIIVGEHGHKSRWLIVVFRSCLCKGQWHSEMCVVYKTCQLIFLIHILGL